nr:MAG TPA: hypothetical protein [Caudoviricetes sp.]
MKDYKIHVLGKVIKALLFFEKKIKKKFDFLRFRGCVLPGNMV